MMFLVSLSLCSCFMIAFARPKEPQCSQYDFAERTLEKVVRFEHSNQLNNERLQALEEKIQKKLDTLDDLESRLRHKLDEVDDKLEESIVNKNDKIDDLLTKKVREIDENLKSLATFREEMTDALKRQQTESETLLENQKMELRQIADTLQTPTILFKAKDATVSSLSDDDVIVFPNDVISIGGGYNNKTGVFTAPVKGVYMFTAQFCIHVAKVLTINIVAADKVISASYFIQDRYDAACYTSDGFTTLEQGDNVTIKVKDKSSGTIIYKDHSRNQFWTSFSGVLLHG